MIEWSEGLTGIHPPLAILASRASRRITHIKWMLVKVASGIRLYEKELISISWLWLKIIFSPFMASAACSFAYSPTEGPSWNERLLGRFLVSQKQIRRKNVFSQVRRWLDSSNLEQVSWFFRAPIRRLLHFYHRRTTYLQKSSATDGEERQTATLSSLIVPVWLLRLVLYSGKV